RTHIVSLVSDRRTSADTLLHTHPVPVPRTATPAIYTLSLHDALPISACCRPTGKTSAGGPGSACASRASPPRIPRSPGRCASRRSEEHTSELQSRGHLVCRLLLEKKKHTLGEACRPTTVRHTPPAAAP